MIRGGNEAGVTLIEVLVTLVVLTLFVGAIAMTMPRGQDTLRAGAGAALAFIQSARATAVATGNPAWLSVSHDKIADSASTLELAPGTILLAEGEQRRAEDVLLLVRADGAVMGQRLLLATELETHQLFVWQAEPEIVR